MTVFHAVFIGIFLVVVLIVLVTFLLMLVLQLGDESDKRHLENSQKIAELQASVRRLAHDAHEELN